MLNMPQMIQTWKEVRYSRALVIAYWVLTLGIERSWPWMEEMAKIVDVVVGAGRIFSLGWLNMPVEISFKIWVASKRALRRTANLYIIVVNNI
jgi:hypothetical protein